MSLLQSSSGRRHSAYSWTGSIFRTHDEVDHGASSQMRSVSNWIQDRTDPLYLLRGSLSDLADGENDRDCLQTGSALNGASTRALSQTKSIPRSSHRRTERRVLSQMESIPDLARGGVDHHIALLDGSKFMRG